MRKYEVVFIIRPMEEEATNAVIEKFSNLIVANGGTIDKEDRWGKKRLAYEIKDCTDGFYCLFEYTAEPACSAELDRVMKITDDRRRKNNYKTMNKDIGRLLRNIK